MTTRSGAAAGGQLEEKIDYAEETKVMLGRARELVETKHDLAAALALLFAWEKKCRVGNDVSSLVSVCEACLTLCKESDDDEALLSTLKTLSTRRAQKSKAVTALLTLALPWVLQTDSFHPLELDNAMDDNKDAKAMQERLVIVLRDITDGKLFLEAERARLTRALAELKEADGKVDEAADILQEVHIETYGTLSKRDKVDFLLEQLRLTLANQDFVRAHIVSNKVNRKTLNEENMEPHKIKYFTLLLQYHQHERDALNLAQDYHHIYSTTTAQQDQVQWKAALTNTTVFLALAKYSPEQQHLMNTIQQDPKLDQIKECKDTVTLLLKKEIIAYPTPHQALLEALPALTSETADWPRVFRSRIVQHNVRVAALYYDRIHGKRLATLLNLTPTELEEELSRMVSDGDVYAKIDRPRDIVRFRAPQSTEELLSDWGGDIKRLLHLVESTTHLIHKEISTQ